MKPVLLVVDDEPDALRSVETEMRLRYANDYEVSTASSGPDALERLAAWLETGVDVALILADQWMPDMSGTELLDRARELYPLSKRGLLISWGDRRAAGPILEAMGSGAFDYYLPKPRPPRSEDFHVVVQGFLLDWNRGVGEGGAVGFTLVGETGTPRMHELRDIFTRNGLAFVERPAESEEGRELLARAARTTADLPLVEVLGTVLSNPSNAEIADALLGDLDAMGGPSGEPFDLAVIGAGPAGLGAAVYAASEGLRTLVVEREAVGGQAGTSSLIRNFLGFPTGISGNSLAIRAYEQAWLFGATFSFMREVLELRRNPGGYVLRLSDGREIGTRAIVIGTGVSYRRLGVPELEALSGAGVFYGAAVSEAPAMKGKRVFISGGGNSAGQAAIHLAKFAEHVTILVRGEALAETTSDYLIKEIASTGNIDVRSSVEVVGGGGRGRLERLLLRDPGTGAEEEIAAAALFVLIGAAPHTDWLPADLARDEWGFILTGRDIAGDLAPPGWPLRRMPMLLETSLPGVFAAGDVRHRSVKRVASAVGEGAIAVTLVHDYLAGAGA